MREGWPTRKLNEIAQVQTGKWDANHAQENGKYRFYTCAFDHMYSDTKRFDGQCLILPGNGANVGEVFYYEGEFDAYQRTYVIDNIKEDPMYVYYHLKAYWKETNLNKQYGSATNYLKIGNFHDYEIPIPPLPEQKRIVEILDEAFEAIDQAKANIEQNIQNAEELFQSKLNEVFSQKGEGWEEMRLCDVCEYDKTRNEKVDLPYVGMQDIESDTGIFLGDLNPKEVKSSTFHFSDSHLLYGRLRPYLNKVLTPDFEGHCSTEIFPIKPNEKINRRFMFYWFIKSSTVEKIDQTSTGARMPRGNMKEVIKFPIGVPTIEVQKRIINKLDKLKEATNSLIENYSSSLNQLEELKKSILQKAFSGELTGGESSRMLGTGLEDEQDGLVAKAAEPGVGYEG